MQEYPKAITMRGNPLTLIGKKINVGDAAPDFAAFNTGLKPVKLSDFKGKVVVISSVPSLDTPVCDLQTRRFNAEATRLGDDVVVLTLSMDLPFAQKRWCGAAGADKVITLSDHKDAAFGTAFGMLIKELRLLARAVLVLDRQGVVRYLELVEEVGREPDYEKALAAIKAQL